MDRFETFVGLISQIYKSIQRIKGMEMTEQGLKANHTMCLYNLSRHPAGLTSAQLSAICEEDKAAISRTVSDLMEGGYVIREVPAGKRKYRTKHVLTKRGEEAARFIGERAERFVEKGGEGLSCEQRENLYASLTLIAENLQRLQSDTSDKADEK